MLDESMVVAGRLTGKWKFKCFVCKTEHKQENTIESCARDFTYRLLKSRITIGSDQLFNFGNSYEAAKKDLIEEYRQLKAEGERVKKEEYRLALDEFSRAETEEEGTQVVLGGLETFVRKKSEEYCSVHRSIAEFRNKLATAPVIVLGDRAQLEVRTHDSSLTVDGEDIPTQYVKLYYEPMVKSLDVRKKLHEQVHRLVWIDVDKDRVVFGLWSHWVSIRPGQDGLDVHVLESNSRGYGAPEKGGKTDQQIEQEAIDWAKG